jgi:hypothetical protein
VWRRVLLPAVPFGVEVARRGTLTAAIRFRPPPGSTWRASILSSANT